MTTHVRAFRLILARSTKKPAMTVTLRDAPATLLAASDGGLLQLSGRSPTLAVRGGEPCGGHQKQCHPFSSASRLA